MTRHLLAASIALLALAVLPASIALPNGLGQLPGLGWNSDYVSRPSPRLLVMYGSSF